MSRRVDALRGAGPALAVAALLAALARTLDHGLDLGLSHGAIELAGRVYFALLLGAPLLLYPLARNARLSGRRALALSLVPGTLWWCTEVGLRLADHSLFEALWLAASPFNTFHLAIALACVAIADVVWRWIARRRNPAIAAPGWKRIVVACLALPLGLLVSLVWVPGFLFGYHAAFQRDLLPTPSRLPGPIEAADVPWQISRAPRPNVVFILSDDHRADFAGYAGHPYLETPALDRLSAEGVRFERAYVTTSLCSPSRASFLTGRTPHGHGVWNNFTPWSNDNRTFFEYLKHAGYDTAFIGKWHMPGPLPELRGVDHFVTFTNLGGQGTYEWNPLVVDGAKEPSRTRYIATELTDRALAWLEARDEGAPPFVLMLSHKSVHADFLPDEPDRGRYADAAVILPDGAHAWTHLGGAQYTHMSFQPLPDVRRKYAEAIVSMDREIGRVLDWLDANELAESTLVVYASDNGYQWGEHGLTDKRAAYEESIRVPFIVRWPAGGATGGTRIDAIVANVDLAPTLLDLAGIAPPLDMQGRSLRHLLSAQHGADAPAPVRDALLYAYYYEPPYPTPTVQALVTPQYKLIRKAGHRPELYDLGADPFEQADLWPSAAPTLRDALGARLDTLTDALP